ncbi:MAG: exosome complex exonuclease Rrp41, partial [Candidatus Hermodarchaeota archaeon]
MIEEKKSLLSEDGIRLDGRKVDELRPISIEVGVLKRANGSAEIKWGNNKIIVAVYGPRELHPKHLAQPDRAIIRCEYRLASFSVDERKSPAPKRREIELSKIISEALEPALFLESYPKASIDVYVQVLNADGGTRCAAIVAAAVALADAGIPMRSLISAVAVGKANGHIILDLSDIEDKEGEGDIPVAIIQNTQDISLFQVDGIFTAEEIKKALELAINASQKIFEIQKEALTHKFRKFEIETEE